jgi:hypothetical protein
MIPWFLSTVALAGGFYHPNDVAMASAQYARATDASATAFENAQDTSMQFAHGVNAYEASLDLLGSRAPASERKRHQRLSAEFNDSFAAMSDFATVLADDYDRVFTEAMDRAVAANAPDAVLCEGSIASGPALPGIRPRFEANPDCEGTDHNPTVVAAMDADPTLISDLDELIGRAWPPFRLPTDKQEAIGDGSWIEVWAFFRTAAPDALAQIQHADDEARLPLEAALENGADPSSLVSSAVSITGQTADARAALADATFQAAAKLSLQWAKSGESFSWCANPRVLGGCDGNDGTKTLGKKLVDHPKVARSLP